MLSLSTQDYLVIVGECGRMASDDIRRLVVKGGGQIIFDDLVRLVIREVGTGTSTSTGDQSFMI